MEQIIPTCTNRNVEIPALLGQDQSSFFASWKAVTIKEREKKSYAVLFLTVLKKFQATTRKKLSVPYACLITCLVTIIIWILATIISLVSGEFTSSAAIPFTCVFLLARSFHTTIRKEKSSIFSIRETLILTIDDVF